jgi:calcineurin-like phosphoesterase family protein
VYHLGDFRFSCQGPNAHELIGKLNGNHVFIQGNHDKRNGVNTPLKYAVIETCGQKVLLCHRPEDAVCLAFSTHFDLAFVGHVHEKWKFRHEQLDMVNVGVDQWDFYPVDAKQILKAYKKWVNEGRK